MTAEAQVCSYHYCQICPNHIRAERGCDVCSKPICFVHSKLGLMTNRDKWLHRIYRCPDCHEKNYRYATFPWQKMVDFSKIQNSTEPDPFEAQESLEADLATLKEKLKE